MKNDTKKLIITIINMIILVGNALISALSNGSIDTSNVAILSSAGLSMLAIG